MRQSEQVGDLLFSCVCVTEHRPGVNLRIAPFPEQNSFEFPLMLAAGWIGNHVILIGSDSGEKIYVQCTERGQSG